MLRRNNLTHILHDPPRDRGPTDEELQRTLPLLIQAFRQGMGNRKDHMTLTAHTLCYTYQGPPKRLIRMLGVRPAYRVQLRKALGLKILKYSQGVFSLWWKENV